MEQAANFPEFFGNLGVVNGLVWPKLTVKRAVYRFRMLSAGNARVLRLSLRVMDEATKVFEGVGPAMTRIANEGGFLPSPVFYDYSSVLHEMVLGPAECVYATVAIMGVCIVLPRLDGSCTAQYLHYRYQPPLLSSHIVSFMLQARRRPH